MRLFRFTIGRALIHFGLAVMPRGRVKAELYRLIDEWASGVQRALR